MFWPSSPPVVYKAAFLQSSHVPKPFDTKLLAIMQEDSPIVAIAVFLEQIHAMSSRGILSSYSLRSSEVDTIEISMPGRRDFECTEDEGFLVSIGKRVVAVLSPFDHSLLLYANNELAQIKRQHTQRVTALLTSKNYIVTGGADCIGVVWSIKNMVHPYLVITQHRSPITALDMNESANILVTGSSDGMLVLFSLTNALYIRSKRLSKAWPTHISILSNGTIFIATCGIGSSHITVYTQNFTEVCSLELHSPIKCMKAFIDNNYDQFVVVAFKNKAVSLIHIPDLAVVWTISNPEFVATTVDYHRTSASIVIGCADGRVLITKRH